MSGWGSGPWGSGPWGGPTVGSFDLLLAIGIDAHTVDLVFSNAILVEPSVLSPGSYALTGGLVVTGVQQTASNVIRLSTTVQTVAVVYTVTVNPTFKDIYGQTISTNVASWTAVADSDVVVTTNLSARTNCIGKRIDLAWSNPVGTLHVKILRRLRSWPFDLTDSATVLYDGAAISEFQDTSDLQPQTYYYYLVLVSASPSPTRYDITEQSKTFALSIDVFDSKDWLKKNTPTDAWRKDAIPVLQGGGGGFLDKWYAVMACWLNLQRGFMRAQRLIADPDNAPYHVLPALNNALGIDPEGDSYDYDIVRRPLTSLAYVYKRKGTCPGIVETVRMFTKWDATCLEFGFNNCRGGASNLRTWDGISSNDFGDLTVGPSVTAADGTATLTDGAHSWIDDLWLEGTLRGPIGDVACVKTNVGNVVAIKPPPGVTTLAAGAAAGATSFSVTSSVGLVPGMSVQITNTTPVSGVYASEIVDIFTIPTPGSPATVNLSQALQNTYAAGSRVTIGKSIMRTVYRGYSGTTSGSFTLTDPRAKFTENQWSGYYVKDSAGNVAPIVHNNGTTLEVGTPSPAAGAYTIAKKFVSGTPHLVYKISNGVHSTIFEPTLDLEERGTLYDPFNRLYSGSASLAALLGAFGPSDVGVLIQGNVPLIKGLAVGAAGAVLTLDPSQPAPTANQLVGNWLNPNQNQRQMFKIVSNSTTQVYVEGDISSLTVPGQAYYVLTPRDKNRFQRISSRLQNEFTDTDVNVFVLFL